MTKIVIEKPSDPLPSSIAARRQAYSEKWKLAAHGAAATDKRTVASPTVERRSKLADGIRAAFAANGFGEKV